MCKGEGRDNSRLDKYGYKDKVILRTYLDGVDVDEDEDKDKGR